MENWNKIALKYEFEILKEFIEFAFEIPKRKEINKKSDELELFFSFLF